jgi:hypothetical protein
MSNTTAIYDDDTYIIGPEIDAILGVKYFASALSLAGSIFMILSYIFFKVKTRNIIPDSHNHSFKLGYGHTLIFLLAISDFIHSLSSFIKTSGFMASEADASCIAQGVLMNIGELSSVCWTTVIALSIYLSTVVQDFKKLRKCYFFFYTLTFTAIFTIGPVITNSYGQAGVWCWLNTKDLDNYEAWVWSLTIYIFHWCNILFNIFAVYKSVKYFNIRAFEIQTDDQEQANFLKNFCIMLKFFPIILVICWVPATINRIYLFASKKENAFLYGLHAFSTTLVGFLNALVYSYYYRNFFKSYCGCRKGDNVITDNNRIEMAAVNNDNNYIKNVEEQEIKNINIINI